jgi:hypothetical protein
MTATITFRTSEWLASAQPAFDAGVFAAAQAAADFTQDSFGSSPSPPGGPPGVDTAQLKDSVVAVSPQALGTPGWAAFGTSKPYGRHLEFGAFIKAKRTKYLYIPIDRRLSLTIRGKSDDFVGPRQNSRSIRGLKFIPRRPGNKPGYGGKFVLAGNKQKVNVRGSRKKTRTVMPGATIAILLDSVRIKPRPWIIRGALQSKREQEAAFIIAAKKVMKGAGLST